MTTPVAFDLELSSPKQITPTTSGRIQVYDFIRGFAVLGILLANIPYFAGPGFSEMVSMQVAASRTDLTVQAWTTVFVAGKFRSMLAMLFGIGMWLQFVKRSQVPGNWPGGYLKRMLILALFGLAHGLLIWPGDILLTYALTGLLVCLFVQFSERVTRWIIGAAAGLALFAGAALSALALLRVDLGGDKGAESLGLTAATETAAFAHGSFLDQLLLRSQFFAMNASSILVMLPFLAGLFLFGLLLAKERVLEAPSQHPRTRCWMLGIGTAALVLSIAIGLAFDSKNGFAFSTAVEFCFGPLLSLGLIMLLAMASESRVLPAIQSAMAKVGRTAFSCYILQSLLGTAIFYSWGGGLFGKLDRLQMLAFVPIIWAADILFAHIWLKRYRMGPLEWAWRSLTEGRRLQNLVSR